MANLNPLKNHFNLSKNGYTLMELAVVMAIIGLLLSATFKAMAFVENAKLQKDLKALQSFQTAYWLYKDRHGKLPGEDANNTGRFKNVFSTETQPTEGFFFDLHQSNLIQNVNPMPEIGSAFKATWGGSSGTNYGLIAQQNQICITDVDVNLGPFLEARMDGADRSAGDIEYTLNGSQLCLLLK